MAATHEFKDVVRAVFDRLDLMAWAIDASGKIIFSEGAALRVIGVEPGGTVGYDVFELYGTPESTAYINRALGGDGHVAITTLEARTLETRYDPILDGAGTITGTNGERDAVLEIDTDITARCRAEEAEARRQQEIIRAQALAIEELSTPLIPIADEILVMPLIGMMDSIRAQQVMHSLLTGLAATRGKFAILDITGVPVVDTAVANAILRAAHAARLLGTEVILTGIRPEVAQTLVHIDADLSNITTRGTLQSGIAYALGRRGRKEL